MKTAAKGMEFQTLHDERLAFREKIIVAIGEDLYSYALEDVAINYLEQTPLEHLDPNNVLDAQGIKKIKMMQSAERETANEIDILDAIDSLREMITSAEREITNERVILDAIDSLREEVKERP